MTVGVAAGVVLRLILSFNISSFYVYLRGLPLYIKMPEQSGAAHSDPPWHRFFFGVTGGSDISEAKVERGYMLFPTTVS